MRSRPVHAGVAALAFSVLTFVGLLVSDPPGGTYSAHDAAKYTASSHHGSVFVGAYLLLLGTFGLIGLLAWGSGLCAAASLAVAWSLMLGVAMSAAFGGHSVTLTPNVTYVIVEVGSAAVWGAGAFLLGVALIALSIAAGAVFPAWLRAAGDRRRRRHRGRRVLPILAVDPLGDGDRPLACLRRAEGR